MSGRTRGFPLSVRGPQPMPAGERLVTSLLVLVLTGASCAAQPPPANFQKAGETALQWVERLVSLGPRPAGSPAQQKQQEVIAGELRSLELEVVEHDFVAQTPKGSVPMKNILAKLPGEGNRVVVVSGHYDTYHRAGLHFVGANDGGSSAGFLLALAHILAASPRADSVWLVFFDGEESTVSWRNNDHTYGSRRLAAKWSADGTASRIKALLNVERAPRTTVFGFGKAGAVIIPIAQGAHIGIVRNRAALQIYRQQIMSAANRRIGMVVRSHYADAVIHADLFSDRAIYQ